MAIDDELEAVRKTGLRYIGSSPSPCLAEASATLCQATFHPLRYLAGLAERITAAFGLAAETWQVL
jgi:hypothetical protein